MSVVVKEDGGQVTVHKVERPVRVNRRENVARVTVTPLKVSVNGVKQSVIVSAAVAPQVTVKRLAPQVTVANATRINQYFSGEGATADDDTLTGLGTQASPLQVSAALQAEIDNKLDSDYARHKRVLAEPGLPGDGETIHYTYQYLIGAVKYTEHRVRNADGEDSLVMTLKENI